eukprot:668801-Hanusia_phi.AAC.4
MSFPRLAVRGVPARHDHLGGFSQESRNLRGYLVLGRYEDSTTSDLPVLVRQRPLVKLFLLVNVLAGLRLQPGQADFRPRPIHRGARDQGRTRVVVLTRPPCRRSAKCDRSSRSRLRAGRCSSPLPSSWPDFPSSPTSPTRRSIGDKRREGGREEAHDRASSWNTTTSQFEFLQYVETAGETDGKRIRVLPCDRPLPTGGINVEYFSALGVADAASTQEVDERKKLDR